MEWYMKVLRQYADFNGRARRKEYWMFTLINMLIQFITAIATVLIINLYPDSIISYIFGVIFILYVFGVIIPSIAVTVRRLHDTSRSGWWIFISLVPAVGTIVLLVFLVQDSNAGANEYGENPKGATTAQPL